MIQAIFVIRISSLISHLAKNRYFLVKSGLAAYIACYERKTQTDSDSGIDRLDRIELSVGAGLTG